MFLTIALLILVIFIAHQVFVYVMGARRPLKLFIADRIAKLVFNTGRLVPSLVPYLRQSFTFMAKYTQRLNKLVKCTKIDIDSKLPFQLYIYESKSSTSGNDDTDGKLPVLLFVHGGGFMYQHTSNYTSILSDIAARNTCIVVSVEYEQKVFTYFYLININIINFI